MKHFSHLQNYWIKTSRKKGHYHKKRHLLVNGIGFCMLNLHISFSWEKTSKKIMFALWTSKTDCLQNFIPEKLCSVAWAPLDQSVLSCPKGQALIGWPATEKNSQQVCLQKWEWNAWCNCGNQSSSHVKCQLGCFQNISQATCRQEETEIKRIMFWLDNMTFWQRNRNLFLGDDRVLLHWIQIRQLLITYF